MTLIAGDLGIVFAVKVFTWQTATTTTLRMLFVMLFKMSAPVQKTKTHSADPHQVAISKVDATAFLHNPRNHFSNSEQRQEKRGFVNIRGNMFKAYISNYDHYDGSLYDNIDWKYYLYAGKCEQILLDKEACNCVFSIMLYGLAC